MIPVFFINLSEQSSRRLWFEEQCGGLGIQPTRVDAVYGRALSEDELNGYRNKRVLDVHFGPAEIGCYLSHMKAWEMFLQTDDIWAFIAEDDIHLAQDSAIFFQSTDWIPADARLIKAESTFKKCHLGKAEPIAGSHRQLRRLLSLHGGAGGYFVHREAAEQLRALSQNLSEPADLLVFNPALGFFSETTCYQIDPAIGAQDLFFETSIDGFQKSSLEVERQGLREAPGASKIWRELKRPFKQLAQVARNSLQKLAWNSEFRAVPFHSGAPREKPEILRTRFK